MNKLLSTPLLLISIFAVYPGTIYAAGSGFECGGMSTAIAFGSRYSYAICHSMHAQIKRSRLEKWQPCTDSIIYVRDKQAGSNAIVMDCPVFSDKQFRLDGDVLLIKHYFEANIEGQSGPVLLQKLNLKRNTSRFEVLVAFPEYSRQQVDQAVAEIDKVLADTADMGRFFRVMYANLYLIRDYGFRDPNYAAKILAGYRQHERVDGEVAETLAVLQEDVALLQKAKGRLDMEAGGQVRNPPWKAPT